MSKNFQRKKEFKEWLKKHGILNFFGRIYGIRWYVRHIRCVMESRLRTWGFRDKRYKRLKQFRNIHEGERCFIVCLGPSLTLQDVEKLKGEYTFSMNSITKVFAATDWRPTYYVMDDPNAYLSLEDDLLRWKMKYCFSSDLLIKTVKPKVDFIAVPYDHLNHSVMFYYPSMKPEFSFSENAYAIVYGSFTVTTTAMQLAIYMGFKEIYLLGCDCDYSGPQRRFNNFGSKENMIDGIEDLMRLSFLEAKKYADRHKLKIYNASRGGQLEVFERVDFDKICTGGDCPKIQDSRCGGVTPAI